MVKNTSGSGFMSLFGGGDTTVNAALPSGEAEDFFETKRVYFTSLETQLKSLARAVDVVVKQREGMLF